MKISRYPNLKNILPLFTLISLHLFILAYWLKCDYSFLINDGFDHYIVSLLKHDMFSSLFNSTAAETNISYFIKWHGTLPETLCGFLLLFAPLSQDSAVFINALIFFSASIIFTYLIAKRFFNARTAIYAAVIFSLLPLINQHIRIFMSDLPLTALITGAAYFLLKAYETKKYYDYLLFIIFSLLAFFTKFNTILFLFFPCLIFLGKNYKNKITLPLLLIVVSTALLISFLNPKISDRIADCLWLNIYENRIYPGFYDTLIVSFLNFTLKSIYEFFNNALSSFAAIAFIFGLLALILKKQYRLFLLFTGFILTPLMCMALFLFIEYDIRYLMPVLPFIAIIAARSITAIDNRYFSRIYATLLLLLLIINNCNLFFTDNNFEKNLTYPLNTQISKILNSKTILEKFNLNPYPYYQKMPDLQFSRDNFYIFTVKNENLFRSSKKMNFSAEKMPYQDLINEILPQISTSLPASVFFTGENRNIYNHLLETVTKEKMQLHIYKAENYRQTKNIDLNETMKNADYVFLSYKEDEIFADTKNTEIKHREKIQALRQNKSLLLDDFIALDFDTSLKNALNIYQKISKS